MHTISVASFYFGTKRDVNFIFLVYYLPERGEGRVFDSVCISG